MPISIFTISSDFNYLVVSKESKVAYLFNTIEEMQSELGGDLNKDYIIYFKTTLSDQFKLIGIDKDYVSHRVKLTNTQKRLRKLGL